MRTPNALEGIRDVGKLEGLTLKRVRCPDFGETAVSVTRREPKCVAEGRMGAGAGNLTQGRIRRRKQT